MGICYSCIKSIKNGKPFMSPINESIDWEHTVPFVPPITEGFVIKVYDGDTITIAAKLHYPESPLYRFQVRLNGIDSPEIKGKSDEEKEAAHKSQRALETLVLHKVVQLKNLAQEKYGRILANVYVKTILNEDLHVNEWLLQQGYAIPYDGKTKQAFHIIHEPSVHPQPNLYSQSK
jgi:endonuclease YncB( thermonuclease family)